MTHALDTPALLAHYLAEPGAERVQALFEDGAVAAGASILSLYEFELRLHQLGVDAARRATELGRYRALLNDVVEVDEAVRSEAIRLRTSATAYVAAMDTLIAAGMRIGLHAMHKIPSAEFLKLTLALSPRALPFADERTFRAQREIGFSS